MPSPLRARRGAFWLLAPDRLVAAVVARGEHEPVLEACAATYATSTAEVPFAPGVVEVAWVLGVERCAHVAALAADFCRFEPETSGDGSHATGVGGTGAEACGSRRAAVADGEGVALRAEERAVARAASLFRRAGLRLVALDSELCALATLVETLGVSDPGQGRRRPLAAVAVRREAEAAAAAIGEDLAVPVGLALGWLGHARAL